VFESPRREDAGRFMFAGLRQFVHHAVEVINHDESARVRKAVDGSNPRCLVLTNK
jgi:hypothetical protein